MKDTKILPDDPKLTAYALGELDGAERAEFEARLRSDRNAQAAVEEIRATIAQLETALQSEEFAAATAVDAEAKQPEGRYSSRKGKLLTFPNLYYLVGGLAAACFAVLLALREPPAPPQQVQKQYTTVPLPVRASQVEETEIVADANGVPALTGENLAKAPAPISTPFIAPAREASPATGLIAQSKQLAERPNAPLMPGLSAPLPDVFPQDYSAANPITLGESPRGERAKRSIANQISRQSRVAAANATFSVGAPLEAENEQPIVLSPFTVESSFAQGYAATSTLGGTRLGRHRKAANTESYAYRPESDFLSARDHPLSTFSADVDTASYANVRRYLRSGQRPPVDAVRIEELINYFPYAYAAPKSTDAVRSKEAPPFAATMEAAEAPWAKGHRLVRIGLKAREVATAERGAANLVFLLDVSGSMSEPNKLPLVKESMKLLLGRLRPDDRVAIVVYAGASGLALPSTEVAQKSEIAEAIEELRAEGSTNGSRGIELAYDIAKANFVTGGINRVILCTDGDFNVGVTSEGGLTRLIEEKAKSGVFLTVLGFGMGNLKDATMQQLANRGNGTYGYIDTRLEAEKLLVQQVSGTLVTVAKDVKLQVEFNPAQVASYRLIGYEKRALKTEDFANDRVDAGDIGAGHAVTALYEIIPVGAADAKTGETPEPELKYVGFSGVSMARVPRPEWANELLTLRVRYKEPAAILSRKLEFALTDNGAVFADASPDFKFTAAVAAFGMLLRGSIHQGNATFASVADWAEAGAATDAGGYRAEFIGLVKQAETLVQ